MDLPVDDAFADCPSGTTQPWGTVATDVADASQCINGCRAEFLVTVGGGGETSLARACESLSDAAQRKGDRRLWSLYCCDSTRCGVWAEQKIGQDPNVNKIINKCQEIGFHDVYDPGPPELGFPCPAHNTNHPNGDGNRCRNPSIEGSPDSDSASSESQAATASTTVSPSATPPPTPVSPTTTPTMPAEVPKPITTATFSLTDGPSAAPSGPAVPQQSPGDDGSSELADYSVGIKATIVICSVVSLLALAAVVLCLHRRRRCSRALRGRRAKRRGEFGGDDGRGFHGGNGMSPAGGSPTPLISPVHFFEAGGGGSGSKHSVIPLTPPLRLRERRLLPTILTSGRPSTASGPSILTPPPGSAHRNQSFPTSPICAPTVSKLEPRRERAPRFAAGGGGGGGNRGAPTATVPRGGPGGRGEESRRRESGSSCYSNPAAAGSTTSSSSTYATVKHEQKQQARGVVAGLPSTTTPPSSPTRPPRPHDSPLVIPGLVSPGPPPDRRLPATPPYGLASPPGSPASTIRPGDIGVALGGGSTGSIGSDGGGGGRGRGGAGVGGGSEAGAVVGLHQEAKDLCELTEEYAREQRDSWGSWGRGGGAPGVGRRGMGCASPVLEEADLERLGGRY